MVRIVIVCEGQTEEEFVRSVLAPHFVHLQLYLEGQTISTSRGHKGGGLSYERVKRHLCATLSQKSVDFVTTFFDFYRIDTQFPGFDKSHKESQLGQKLQILYDQLHNDIIQETGCRPNRFLPYIQSHEFEALLFSDVSIITEHESRWSIANKDLHNICKEVDTPEHIENPAIHLKDKLHHPDYRKTRHGPVIAQKIGLHEIQTKCPFFAKWLQQIRQLAAT